MLTDGIKATVKEACASVFNAVHNQAANKMLPAKAVNNHATHKLLYVSRCTLTPTSA